MVYSKKRWYFNTKLSKNIPFVGGSKIGFGTSKPYKKRYRYYKKNSFNRKVKRAVNDLVIEPRHKLISQYVNLTRDTWWTQNPLGNISQGTAFNQRSGDKIHLDAIKARIHIHCPASVENTNVRLMAVWHDNEYFSGTDPWGSALGNTDLCFPGGINQLTSLIDSKKVTVISDKTFNIKNNYSTHKPDLFLNFTMKLNKDFVYKTASNYGKYKNLYFVALAFAEDGVTGTTVQAVLNSSFDVIFKDV